MHKLSRGVCLSVVSELETLSYYRFKRKGCPYAKGSSKKKRSRAEMEEVKHEEDLLNDNK